MRAAERPRGKTERTNQRALSARSLRIGRSAPASLPGARARPGVSCGGPVSRGLEEELLATAATEEAGGGEGAGTEDSEEVEAIGSFWILYPVF